MNEPREEFFTPDGVSPALRVLADALPQIVWTARPDGFLDYYNQQWHDYTGLTLEETQGWGWGAVLHPDDLQNCLDRWSEAVRTGTTYEIQYRFRRADGVYRWHLGRALPVRDEAGVLTQWMGTCTDIDDQKRAELTLASVAERERNISETLQGALIPAVPQRIPGLDLASYYKAALDEAKVGGDFMDVFPVEKGCYVLVVGDLSGKGLAAAAQVATVRNMLRYALYTGQTIAEGVTRLNSILIANHLLTGFATLVVVTFDLGMQTLTYVSCGQEPALLRRRANGDVEELPPTGPVLGALEGAAYTETVVPLVVGDTFALYTDGLTEAGPDRQHLLGVEGLAALLQEEAETAQAMVARIVDAAEAYSNHHFGDDVCLLVGVVSDAAVER